MVAVLVCALCVWYGRLTMCVSMSVSFRLQYKISVFSDCRIMPEHFACVRACMFE